MPFIFSFTKKCYFGKSYFKFEFANFEQKKIWFCRRMKKNLIIHQFFLFLYPKNEIPMQTKNSWELFFEHFFKKFISKTKVWRECQSEKYNNLLTTKSFLSFVNNSELFLSQILTRTVLYDVTPLKDGWGKNDNTL